MAALLARKPESFLSVQSITNPIGTPSTIESATSANNALLPSELHRARFAGSRHLSADSSSNTLSGHSFTANALSSTTQIPYSSSSSTPAHTPELFVPPPGSLAQIPHIRSAAPYLSDQSTQDNTFSKNNHIRYGYPAYPNYGYQNTTYLPSPPNLRSSPVHEPAGAPSSHGPKSFSPQGPLAPSDDPSTPSALGVSPELASAFTFSPPLSHHSLSSPPHPDSIMSFTDSTRFNPLSDNISAAHYGSSKPHETPNPPTTAATAAGGISLSNSIMSDNTPSIMGSYGTAYSSSSGTPFVSHYGEFSSSQPVHYAPPTNYPSLPAPTSSTEETQGRHRSDVSSSSIPFGHQYGAPASQSGNSNTMHSDFMMRYDATPSSQVSLLAAAAAATSSIPARTNGPAQTRLPSAFPSQLPGYSHSSPSSTTPGVVNSSFYTSSVPSSSHEHSLYNRNVLSIHGHLGVNPAAPSSYPSSDSRLADMNVNMAQQAGHSHATTRAHLHSYSSHPHSHPPLHARGLSQNIHSDVAGSGSQHSSDPSSTAGPGVRVLTSRPKPQCWDHGCNGREFSTFSNLLRHQREKSGLAAKSNCPRCGAEFTRTTARNGHMAHDKCRKRSQGKPLGSPPSDISNLPM